MQMTDRLLELLGTNSGHGDNPDFIITGMNCLLHLIEFNPDITQSIISHGTLKLIVEQHLTNFEFLDIADVAINVISKLTQFASREVLVSGCIQKMVEVFDFFEVGL